MTDPEVADKTYIEPITIEMVTKIIARERPEQRCFPLWEVRLYSNTAVSLAEKGKAQRIWCRTYWGEIGSHQEEDRSLFKSAMKRIGIAVPDSGYARSYDDAMKAGLSTRLASQPDNVLLLPWRQRWKCGL